MEEDVKGSQDQDDHDQKSPRTDKGDGSQSPSSNHAIQSREKKRPKGNVSEDEGDVSLEDNTSEARPQPSSCVPQVCTNNTH